MSDSANGWCQLLRGWLAGVAPVDVSDETGAVIDLTTAYYDIVIVDASEVSDPIRLVADLRHGNANADILIAASAPNWEQARDAFCAGAKRYFVRSDDVTDILAALAHRATRQSGEERGAIQ